MQKYNDFFNTCEDIMDAFLHCLYRTNMIFNSESLLIMHFNSVLSLI